MARCAAHDAARDGKPRAFNRCLHRHPEHSARPADGPTRRLQVANSRSDESIETKKQKGSKADKQRRLCGLHFQTTSDSSKTSVLGARVPGQVRCSFDSCQSIAFGCIGAAVRETCMCSHPRLQVCPRAPRNAQQCRGSGHHWQCKCTISGTCCCFCSPHVQPRLVSMSHMHSGAAVMFSALDAAQPNLLT